MKRKFVYRICLVLISIMLAGILAFSIITPRIRRSVLQL